MVTRILNTHLAYFIALGNARTLEGDASVRTAFQVIEDANTDVGNLRSMCSLYANKLLTVSYYSFNLCPSIRFNSRKDDRVLYILSIFR